MGTNSPPKVDLLQGTLDLLILRVLQPGPQHGWAIAQRIHLLSQEALRVEEGSLYPALNRMLLKGWLRAEWGTSDTNRKARFYQLTKAGQKQLASEASEFNKLVTAIQMVMKSA